MFVENSAVCQSQNAYFHLQEIQKISPLERTCGFLSQITNNCFSADKGNNGPHSILQGFIFSVSYTQWKCKFCYLLLRGREPGQSWLRHILGIQNVPYPMPAVMSFILTAFGDCFSGRWNRITSSASRMEAATLLHSQGLVRGAWTSPIKEERSGHLFSLMGIFYKI